MPSRIAPSLGYNTKSLVCPHCARCFSEKTKVNLNRMTISEKLLIRHLEKNHNYSNRDAYNYVKGRSETAVTNAVRERNTADNQSTNINSNETIDRLFRDGSLA